MGDDDETKVSHAFGDVGDVMDFGGLGGTGGGALCGDLTVGEASSENTESASVWMSRGIGFDSALASGFVLPAFRPLSVLVRLLNGLSHLSSSVTF